MGLSTGVGAGAADVGGVGVGRRVLLRSRRRRCAGILVICLSTVGRRITLSLLLVLVLLLLLLLLS